MNIIFYSAAVHELSRKLLIMFVNMLKLSLEQVQTVLLSVIYSSELYWKLFSKSSKVFAIKAF